MLGDIEAGIFEARNWQPLIRAAKEDDLCEPLWCLLKGKSRFLFGKLTIFTKIQEIIYMVKVFILASLTM